MLTDFWNEFEYLMQSDRGCPLRKVNYVEPGCGCGKDD